MCYVWTSLAKHNNIVLDKTLIGVSQCEMAEFKQTDALKSLLPRKMTPMNFKFYQRVLVYAEAILDISIGQEMTINYLAQIWKDVYQFDYIYGFGTILCLQKVKCLSDD